MNCRILKHLAAADDDLLHKLWEGLGYYNRVRNMKKCAQVCVEKYGGELPCDYDTLCTLPGIALIRRGSGIHAFSSAGLCSGRQCAAGLLEDPGKQGGYFEGSDKETL